MKMRWGILAGALLAGLAASAEAASTLADRGYWNASGNYSATAQSGYMHMVYEADRNLTWLDYSYEPVVYSSDGSSFALWQDAVDWALGGTWGNRTDWRLTSVTDIGNDGYTGGLSDAGGDWGIHLDTSTGEMAHLWYDELGNIPYYDTSGIYTPAGAGLTNTGPFQNLQSDVYWSGTEYAPNTIRAWYFDTGFGGQFAHDKWGFVSALAVRTGDIAAAPSAVPLPGAVWLFASALLGLTGAARRRSALG